MINYNAMTTDHYWVICLWYCALININVDCLLVPVSSKPSLTTTFSLATFSVTQAHSSMLLICIALLSFFYFSFFDKSLVISFVTLFWCNHHMQILFSMAPQYKPSNILMVISINKFCQRISTGLDNMLLLDCCESICNFNLVFDEVVMKLNFKLAGYLTFCHKCNITLT